MSIPSPAGRSRPSGGLRQSSVSTGRSCSTATCCANCSTTSLVTNGSSSGSMTELSEAAIRRPDRLKVGDLLDPCTGRIEVQTIRSAAHPQAVAVRDDPAAESVDFPDPTVRRAAVDGLLRVRIEKEQELGGVFVDEDADDRMVRTVNSHHAHEIAWPVEPRSGAAVSDVKPLHLVGPEAGRRGQGVGVGRVEASAPHDAAIHHPGIFGTGKLDRLGGGQVQGPDADNPAFYEQAHVD